MKLLLSTLTSLCALSLTLPAFATETPSLIPMWQGNATTFYVKAAVGNLNEMDFMVDTGSGYMTINEETLAVLQKDGQAQYQRELRGVLANGSEIVVPVYQLAQLDIGNCRLTDIEAAVFPGKTRQILGLNALMQAGNFGFSFNPPQLDLTSCPQTRLITAGVDQ